MEHFYHTIQGWFDFQNLYSSMVSTADDNAVFVEIGTWKGMSTAFLGVEIVNSGKNIKVYAVDTFLGSDESAHREDASIINGSLYEEFCSNIEPIKHIVIPVKNSSVKASEDFADSSVDFVFIDGGHTFEDAYSDICAWLPKVKSGGYIAGHDYGSSEDVRKAVHLLLPDAINMLPNSWIQRIN